MESPWVEAPWRLAENYVHNCRQFHCDATPIAAKALKEQGITLVEYGEQVLFRSGQDSVLMRVEWGVPDEQLSLASRTLADLGFQRTAPTQLFPDRWGHWEVAGVAYCQNAPYRSNIYLYPLSLLGLTLDDTVEVNATFDREIKLLSPRPTAYMLSLLRYLLTHPTSDRGRRRVQIDLVSFISHYIFQDPPPRTDLEVHENMDDNESEEDFQKRVEKAVLYMRSWDWGTTPKSYLDIAEGTIRDCRTIHSLSEADLPS